MKNCHFPYLHFLDGVYRWANKSWWVTILWIEQQRNYLNGFSLCITDVQFSLLSLFSSIHAHTLWASLSPACTRRCLKPWHVDLGWTNEHTYASNMEKACSMALAISFVMQVPNYHPVAFLLNDMLETVRAGCGFCNREVALQPKRKERHRRWHPDSLRLQGFIISAGSSTLQRRRVFTL